MPTHFFLKPGCIIHPFHGAGVDECIVETPEARKFKLSGTARRLIEQLHQGTSVEDLSAQIPEMTGEDLHKFILTNYGEFLVDESGRPFAEPAQRPKGGAKTGLLASWTILPGTLTSAVSSRLRFLFAPAAAVPSLFCIFVSHLLLYSNHTLAHARLTGAHVSVLLLLCALSVLVHELGHASALSRYGGTPSGIGFGLFILLPVFYADVSQAWKLRRWQRIVVDIGGIYFQQLFFALAALLATLWNSPSLRAVCVAIDLMTVIALNPAFRFDGYWVVADWLGLTHLHRSAGLYLRSMVRSIVRRRSARSEYPPHLSRAKTLVFVCYALLSNVFLTSVIALNLRWVYSTALALVKGLPLLGHALFKALGQGNWIGSADLAVACGFLLASGVTVIVAAGWQARIAVHFLRQRYLAAANTTSQAFGGQ